MQYVYLLREGQGYYKVGISHNVRSRVQQLQYHVPNKIEIVCTKFMDTQAYAVEQELHKYLEEHKTAGANEWFQLTAEQAVDLCIRINNYPDIDISERVTLATIAQNVKRNQRLIEKKLDYVINTYQKERHDPGLMFVPALSKETKQPEEPIEPEVYVPTKEELEAQMFDRAVEVIKKEGRASTSLLQRRLRIGYGRAARMIEELEEKGIVGAADGSRARSVRIAG